MLHVNMINEKIIRALSFLLVWYWNSDGFSYFLAVLSDTYEDLMWLLCIELAHQLIPYWPLHHSYIILSLMEMGEGLENVKMEEPRKCHTLEKCDKMQKNRVAFNKKREDRNTDIEVRFDT